MTDSGTEINQPKKAERIGVLGGTFDPIHHAHLRMAEESFERLNLDRVLLVLSASPPHKENEGITPFETRWKMLRAVCENNSRLVPVDLEAKRGGPSYTKDTLKAIRKEYGPDSELVLLVGMDSAVEFCSWKSYEEILELSRLVVFGRPGEDPKRIDPKVRDRMVLLDWDEFGISSTAIRRKVSEGRSIRYLVPPEVEEIIEMEKLYRSPSGSRVSSEGNIAQGEVFV
ncbi:MAG: nicotinate-nucleotide adenylyltransferase [Candidatus Omnitrophica bacterium]|nr:nicotinate-nucleotide adenylyltransferase [Candidatus Omnitrophota bacterium]